MCRASMSNDDRQGYCSDAQQSPMGGDGREDILMMHNNCARSRKLGKCIVSSNRKLSSENIARINSIRCSMGL